MTTFVRDLMSSPPMTCDADTSLAAAARRMDEAGIGSVIVTEGPKVAGILTERDLLRAAATGADPAAEPTRLWMTLVGVVSLRDLLGSALLRPADEHGADVPRGLEGVVVAETAVGDVRGEEGFYHYRQYPAVELAAKRSFEDVWYLLVEGELPDRAAALDFGRTVAGLRTLPDGLASQLPALAAHGAPLDVLRTAVSLIGSELGWEPTLDTDRATLRRQALRLCAVVPTVLAASHRLRRGEEPVAPRPRPRLRRQLPVDDAGHRT